MATSKYPTEYDEIVNTIQMYIGGSKLTMEVVGVAKNMRDHRLRADIPVRFYVPAAHGIGRIIMARGIDELIDAQNQQPRTIAQLCGVFAATALMLAAIGLYGVLSYSVPRRTRSWL